MIIRLVSLPYWDPNNEDLGPIQRRVRRTIATKILNEKGTDFVMFSESIFQSKKDLKMVCKGVNNKKVTALFELSLSDDIEGNHLFLLQNGIITDL